MSLPLTKTPMFYLFGVIFLGKLTSGQNFTQKNIDFRFIPSISTVKGILVTKNEILEKGQLIFEDNFEFFNKEKWERQPNTKGHFTEFQWYTSSEENSYVKDGKLHIRPTLCIGENSFSSENILESRSIEESIENCTHCNGTFYPIKSGRVSTQHSFSFKYGFVEVSAKIPSGDWLWPAIWLLSSDNKYGNWPRSGEIDMMESRGNKNLKRKGVNVGCEHVYSTLHFGPDRSNDPWNLTTCDISDSSFSTSFHKYQMSWTPDKITFLIDDLEHRSITPPEGGFWELGHFSDKTDLVNPWINGTKLAPFDQEFFLIMNIAVGGTTFFSDSWVNEGGKPWTNKSPQPSLDFWNGRDQWLPTWNLESDDSHMIVDYVRVWAA